MATLTFASRGRSQCTFENKQFQWKCRRAASICFVYRPRFVSDGFFLFRTKAGLVQASVCCCKGTEQKNAALQQRNQNEKRSRRKLRISISSIDFVSYRCANNGNDRMYNVMCILLDVYLRPSLSNNKEGTFFSTPSTQVAETSVV